MAEALFGRACFDDLEVVERTIWSAFKQGVTRRGSGFGLAGLSYVCPFNGITSKNWLLREVDSTQRVLRFYTDARSGKVAAVEQHPQIALLFYDRNSLVQLSVQGHASIFADQARFSAQRGTSHVNYQTMPTPGDALDNPALAKRDDSLGGRNFRVCEIVVNTIDWVWLAEKGHRRARFIYEVSTGTVTAQWLVP